MRIYIPTYQRVNKQITWGQLPPDLLREAFLVVTAEEAPLHKAQGRNVVVSERQGLGMAAVRGWILRHAIKTKQKTFCIVDDDLVFQMREEKPESEITFTKTGEPLRFRIRNSKPFEVKKAFRWLEYQVQMEVAHASMSPRGMYFKEAPLFLESVRTMQAIAYRTEAVVKAKAAFDKDVPDWFPMDDFHMNLQMLEAGYKNRLSLIYRTNPAPSNAPGGCSEQRTLERQNESAELLAKLHPNSVKVREKKAWRGMDGQVMLDVSVLWKKALKEGRK